MALAENRNSRAASISPLSSANLISAASSTSMQGTASQASPPSPRLIPVATISTATSRNRLCQYTIINTSSSRVLNCSATSGALAAANRPVCMYQP